MSFAVSSSVHWIELLPLKRGRPRFFCDESSAGDVAVAAPSGCNALLSGVSSTEAVGGAALQ